MIGAKIKKNKQTEYEKAILDYTNSHPGNIFDYRFTYSYELESKPKPKRKYTKNRPAPAPASYISGFLRSLDRYCPVPSYDRTGELFDTYSYPDVFGCLESGHRAFSRHLQAIVESELVTYLGVRSTFT